MPDSPWSFPLALRYRFMAMDRLGSDLQKVCEHNGGRLKKATVLQLGQVLVRARAVQGQYWVRHHFNRWTEHTSVRYSVLFCFCITTVLLLFLMFLCIHALLRWTYWSTSMKMNMSMQTSKLPTSCWATETLKRLVIYRSILLIHYYFCIVLSSVLFCRQWCTFLYASELWTVYVFCWVLRST